MDRTSGTRALKPMLGDAVVVAGLGYASWALFTEADRDQNLYLGGSMGLASSVAMGLALSRRERQVLCLEGDVSMLMNLGSVATIGALQPSNLTLLVWDDELYLTTGGQSTHTGDGVSLAAIARGCGIGNVSDAGTEDQLRCAVTDAFAGSAPSVIVAKIGREATRPQRCRMPLIVVRHRLMQALGMPRGWIVDRSRPAGAGTTSASVSGSGAPPPRRAASPPRG